MNKICLLGLLAVGINTISAAQPEYMQVCRLNSDDTVVLVACGTGKYENGFCKCYIVREAFKKIKKTDTPNNTIPSPPDLYDGNKIVAYNTQDTSVHGQLKYIPLNRLDLKRSLIIQKDSDDMSEFTGYEFKHEYGDISNLKEPKIIIKTIDKNHPVLPVLVQPDNKPIAQIDNQKAPLLTQVISNKLISYPIKQYCLAAVAAATIGSIAWWLHHKQHQKENSTRKS